MKGYTRCPCQKCRILPSGGQDISDQLRNVLNSIERVAGPLLVTSGFRCCQHNADIGASQTSLHLDGIAADVDIFSPAQRYKFIASAIENDVPFIEVCTKHVHIDLRTDPVPHRLILGEDK